MKFSLLNDGGYLGLDAVDFPVEVYGRLYEVLDFVCIPYSELERVGADICRFNADEDEEPFVFLLGAECEKIDNEKVYGLMVLTFTSCMLSGAGIMIYGILSSKGLM